MSYFYKLFRRSIMYANSKNALRIVFASLFILVSHFSVLSQSDKDFEIIKSKLLEQQDHWNNGDLDSFMETYWKSDDLQFGGASGITKGWQKTLDNYKVRYPDRTAMGKLKFEVKDISRHSEKVVSLTGSWHLTRSIGDIGGHFLLIWRNIEDEWVIVVDHTSQAN